jgi:hypothetical protein
MILKFKEKIKISDAYNFLYNGQILVEPFIMIGTKTTPATNIDKIQDSTTLKKGLKEFHS